MGDRFECTWRFHLFDAETGDCPVGRVEDSIFDEGSFFFHMVVRPMQADRDRIENESHLRFFGFEVFLSLSLVRVAFPSEKPERRYQ